MGDLSDIDITHNIMAAAQQVSITDANGAYQQPDHLDFSWAPPLYERNINEGRPVRIVCVGAGFSGLCAAVHFKDHLTNFELQIYERGDDVGGVWNQNRYPGVACDVPSHSYQLSFCEKTDWSAYYAPGSEIHGYLSTVAERYNLRQYIKLQHTVTHTRWDEERGKWFVTVTNAAGESHEDECDFVLFATGLLSKPIWPDNIPGRASFKGTMVHSGDWKAAKLPEDPAFWADKRVGVIGMGASGVQIVPTLQKKALSVTNFGRSKLWISGGWGSKMFEKLHKYKKDRGTNYFFTDEDIAAFKSEEAYRKFRCEIEEDLGSTHELSFRGHPLQAVFADKFTETMRDKLARKPEIAAAILPDFPVGCKRLSPGPGYLEALCEDNCGLVTDKIESFTPRGIRTADGTEHELDIIVCATGFDVTFIPAFPIIGRGGINIQELWAKESRTYLGMFAPEMPNAFNVLTTQAAAGSGSLLVVLEQQCAYITKMIGKCQRDGYRSFAPRRKAVDDFLKYTDAYFGRTVLTSSCRSWYKNGETGEATIRAIWPGSGSHAFMALQHPRWEDFEWETIKEHEHSMSWLGNGCAPYIDGAGVHLAMRGFYRPQTHYIY
ncbi:FAD/NAD(P)-binding domain-containing protein [Cutaneotrichosporon oleaginosum]|uniref:FAD/NAD(P)-binding domain-containing protein n=1 Tax=Cutaneotrichosporon oleaginosum TaxID=879819 RepID=A0A0J0XBP1_9TREE|nr:FAD/NAD(P)-binding domain-containing protein [Cutaneotrichosporon oleaginosum]KLT38493.1 FAD/NAD(P)-binding domain-containing protein [Cutaneotrichosporon oleaginosum]TXT12571.1 hypothetical protein COLE_02981 [Cutaneotrichosporon oleaginosum]